MHKRSPITRRFHGQNNFLYLSFIFYFLNFYSHIFTFLKSSTKTNQLFFHQIDLEFPIKLFFNCATHKIFSFFFFFQTVLIECKNANELLGENFLEIGLVEFEKEMCKWAILNFRNGKTVELNVSLKIKRKNIFYFLNHFI